MEGFLEIAVVIAGWFALQVWILPRFGIGT